MGQGRWRGRALLAALLAALTLGGAGGSARAQPPAAEVTMRGRAFLPFSLTVQAGQTVIWTNGEAEPHSVVADGGGFGSGYLSLGQRFEQRFDQPGSYSYYCDIHQGMDGLIQVEPAPQRLFLPWVVVRGPYS